MDGERSDASRTIYDSLGRWLDTRRYYWSGGGLRLRPIRKHHDQAYNQDAGTSSGFWVLGSGIWDWTLESRVGSSEVEEDDTPGSLGGFVGRRSTIK
jgi:hypothetical protein